MVYVQHDKFTVKTTDGKIIRTTLSYWHKISRLKHREFIFSLNDVFETIAIPDSVSSSDKNIRLFFKRFNRYDIIAVVRILNGDGFLITCYQTSKGIKALGKL